MKTYTAAGGVIRDERGRTVGRATGGELREVQVDGVHATAWPADGGQPTVLKAVANTAEAVEDARRRQSAGAVRPTGHEGGCGCVICVQLEEPETDDIESGVLEPCPESGGEEMSDKKLAKLAKQHEQNMDNLVKSVAARLSSIEDPGLRAHAGQAVTRWRLYQANRRRGFVKAAISPVEAPVGQASGLPGETTAEAEVRNAAEMIAAAQQRATAPALATASARGQLEAARDGTAQPRTIPGQTFLPSLMHDGQDLQSLEKAVARAATPFERQQAGHALTLARLTRLNRRVYGGQR